MATYKCTYTFDGTTTYEKCFLADSEDAAGQMFDDWVDDFPEYPELLLLEKVA